MGCFFGFALQSYGYFSYPPNFFVTVFDRGQNFLCLYFARSQAVMKNGLKKDDRF